MRHTDSFTVLRESNTVKQLIEEADEFNCSLDDLENREVTERDDGSSRVVLRAQTSESTSYLVQGVVTPDIEVIDVWIEKVVITSPLAGRGTQWAFEDGSVIEREWVS